MTDLIKTNRGLAYCCCWWCSRVYNITDRWHWK